MTERTPLPKKQLFSLGCVFLSEVFTISMLFPFVAFMVKDFEITNDDTEIGYYAGVLASVFSFAQFLSSFLWGRWSDRVGRKKVLMIGMAGSVVAVVFFGMSMNYGWAIAARFIHGLLNGNIGVARGFIGDITDETNQGYAMSIVSTILSVGIVLGPTVGGFLSEPGDKYPEIFGHSGFFHDFPYILPCLISSFIAILGLTTGYFFLDGDVGKRKEAKTNEDGSAEPEQEDLSSLQTLVLLAKMPVYRILCICYALLVLTIYIFVEVLALWVINDYSEGGLNFTSDDVGITFAVVGISVFVYQLFIYPRIERITGSLLLFKCNMIALGPCMALFPILAELTEYPTYAVWIGMVILSIIRAMLVTGCFTAAFVLINSSVTTEYRGAASGLSESFASFCKAIGPVSGGAILAWSLGNGLPFPLNHYLVFFLCGISTLAGGFLTLRISNSDLIPNDAEEINPLIDESITEGRPKDDSLRLDI